MPARRRALRAPYRRAQRSPTSWARIVSTAQVAVPAASKVLLASLVLSNPGIGETVRRTRGRFAITSDQAATIQNQQGALGFVVVSDLALAAGAASIPGPVTEASDDGWYVWEGFVMRSAAVANNISSYVVDFDSKAMRRVEEGFGVAIMVENADPAHGLVVNYAFSSLTSLS